MSSFELGLGSMDTALIAEYCALLKYAKRVTRNGPEATDLVHTAMMQALTKGDRGPNPGKLGAWLRTTLLRLFIDERRRAKREATMETSMFEHPEAPNEPLPKWTFLTVDDVRDKIALLPPHFREPYELFTFRKLSYGKIAALSGLSSKTVGTRINRARRRLRALLLESSGGSLHAPDSRAP